MSKNNFPKNVIDLKKKIKNYSIFDKGFAPWVHWESENSSFGKLIRYQGYYSKFLPIFVNSDHAVHTESKLWKNEIETKSNIPYLTWNYRKYLKMKKIKKNTFYITNPWSFYVSQKKKNTKKGIGTLIFYPHSNFTTMPIINNDQYFKKLLKLPKKFKPLTIMLSYHDINRGIHLKLAKYKIPIVTAGSIQSRKFVDKFINIISKFKYATSPNHALGLSTSFFYCVDFGIKYFFYHTIKWRHIDENIEFKKKILKSSDFLDYKDMINFNKLKKKFSYKNFEKNENSKKLIKKYMGYDSKVSRKKLLIILIRSLILNFFLIPGLYLKAFFKFLKLN